MENKDHLTHRSRSSKWVADRAAASSERFNGYLSGAKAHRGCDFLDNSFGAETTAALTQFLCVLCHTLISQFILQKICHLGKWLREIVNTHFLWLLDWLVMNWRSPSVLPRFPSVSDLQGLRPSGQTLNPLYLTSSSPTCTQLQGLLRQGVTREKSFHFKSLCFCFPSQTQEISLSAELGGWYVTLFSGGVKTIVLAQFCALDEGSLILTSPWLLQ